MVILASEVAILTHGRGARAGAPRAGGGCRWEQRGGWAGRGLGVPGPGHRGPGPDLGEGPPAAQVQRMDSSSACRCSGRLQVVSAGNHGSHVLRAVGREQVSTMRVAGGCDHQTQAGLEWRQRGQLAADLAGARAGAESKQHGAKLLDPIVQVLEATLSAKERL